MNSTVTEPPAEADIRWTLPAGPGRINERSIRFAWLACPSDPSVATLALDAIQVVHERDEIADLLRQAIALLGQKDKTIDRQRELLAAHFNTSAVENEHDWRPAA